MERRSPEQPRKKPEITPITPDVEVGMGEFKMVHTPDVGATTALGPCTGIIIFNPRIKTAVVGHFTDPVFGDADEMLEEIKEEFEQDLHILKVNTGGAAQLEIEDDDSIAKQNRDATIKAIEKMGIKREQIQTRWTEKGKNTIMQIQTKTGKVDYLTVDDNELKAA